MTHRRWSDEELCAELRRIADVLGHPPSIQEFRDRSPISTSTYYRHFGSWPVALAAAGFESYDPATHISSEALRDELQQLATEIGKRPTQKQMDERGAYSAATYRQRFGSWQDALAAAGFEPRTRGSRIPESELLRELQELAEEMGSSPTVREMDEHGRFSSATYTRRFGSWCEALQAAQLPTSPARSEVDETELQNALRRLATELGRVPTSREMKQQGPYAASTYQRRFGSWETAVEAALEPNEESNADDSPLK